MGDNNVLVVDDDLAAIQIMGRMLEGLGLVRFATNGEDAVRLATELAPDLVLLDAEMPGMSGFKVFDALKALPELIDVPVIFVTSHCEPAFEICALNMGAADFISKPVRPPLVKARVKTHLRVKHLADELRRCAVTDALTGIANRRHFDDLLEREWQRSCRHGDPLSLLLIDVDHFKRYNDHYGHPRGDRCLQEVVAAVKRAVRRAPDLVARCGGEEFAVLLPHTARPGAEFVAQRILDSVAARRIRHEDSLTAAHVTVSIGITCYDAVAGGLSITAASHRTCDAPHAFSSSDLLLTADRALYAAKRAGRNRARFLDLADVESPHRPQAAAARVSPAAAA
jgi:diguanylate cyclase (GGDEF)-like protein